MRERSLRVTLALGLVLSALVGALGTASADHDENAPDMGHAFLPWVPNGATLGDQGPYYGAVTVQNLEDAEAEVDVYVGGGEAAGGWTLEESITLASNESMTLAADTLGIPEDGASVALEGFLQREETDDDDEVTQEAIAARIAAVTKNLSPTGGTGGTTEDHEVVDGYSALTAEQVVQDFMEFSDGTYILPIVQTNNEWDTVIRVANLSDDGGLTNATVTLYGSGTQGFAGESEVVNLQLDAGQTGTVNLSDHVPEGWVGSAYITSSADIGAVAERYKEIDDMLISNVSRPEHHEGTTKYGALVFKEYNFWNTGISVANVDDDDTNSVTISYIGPTSNVVGQDTLTIPPRGQEYVYTPGSQDLGLEDGFVGSVVIEGTHELHAAIDQVKYFGDDPDVGQAMSYVADDNLAEAGESLALPLAQKGNPATGGGDTSGIQLFNADADSSVDAEIVFYGANGLPVAPTVENNDPDPMTISLGAYQSYTLYTHEQSELSSGFQGSVAIDVVGGDGELIGVSNNVNYDVQGDGSTAFNLIRSEPRQAATFTVTPEDDENLVFDEHEIMVEVRDQFGAVVEGAEVTADVTDGPNVGTTLEPDPAVTDAAGQASLSYTSNGVPGEDTITVSVDGIDEVATATKTWGAVEEGQQLTLEQDSGLNQVGDEHTVTATVTDEADDPVEDALVEFEVDGTNGPLTGAALTDANGQAEFSYIGEAEGDDTINATVFGTDLEEELLKVWTTADEEATTSGADEAEEVEDGEGNDWWRVEILDEEGNQLLPRDSDRILYERPDGETMELPHAGTSYLWWEQDANYAEGVHTLYYLFGDTWYVLTSEFDENGDLIAVNGEPVSP